MIIEEKIVEENDEPAVYTVSDVAEAIAKAVAAEREMCARVCDEFEGHDWTTGLPNWATLEKDAAQYCAAAIRARK